MLPEIRNRPSSRRDREHGGYRRFIFAPSGYRRVLFESPVSVALTTSSVPFTENESARFEAEKRERWIKRTELEPQESRFTLIVPIHNEQALLRDSLTALMASDIPRSVRMNVILATNDCTDGSVGIVEDFMAGLGSVQARPFDEADSMDKSHRSSLDDEGLDKTYYVVQPENSNITFTHINTSTAGKANVLNIGNKLAKEAGHRVTISTDGNNFVEWDAVRNIFGDANALITDETDDTVILSGNDQYVWRKGRYRTVRSRLKREAKQQERERESTSKVRVSGWLLAWDTDFIDSVGGIPEVTIEDYAMGIIALMHGKKTQRVDDARTWGFASSRIRDRFMEQTRAVKGYYQLVNKGEEIRETMRQQGELYYDLKLRERVKSKMIKAKDNPHDMPFVLLKFALQEGSRVVGRRAYRKDPDNHSWRSILSTKGNR